MKRHARHADTRLWDAEEFGGGSRPHSFIVLLQRVAASLLLAVTIGKVGHDQKLMHVNMLLSVIQVTASTNCDGCGVEGFA